MMRLITLLVVLVCAVVGLGAQEPPLPIRYRITRTAEPLAPHPGVVQHVIPAYAVLCNEPRVEVPIPGTFRWPDPRNPALDCVWQSSWVGSTDVMFYNMTVDQTYTFDVQGQVRDEDPYSARASVRVTVRPMLIAPAPGDMRVTLPMRPPQ
jgi:hypothetical protein